MLKTLVRHVLAALIFAGCLSGQGPAQADISSGVRDIFRQIPFDSLCASRCRDVLVELDIGATTAARREQRSSMRLSISDSTVMRLGSRSVVFRRAREGTFGPDSINAVILLRSGATTDSIPLRIDLSGTGGFLVSVVAFAKLTGGAWRGSYLTTLER